MATYRLAQSAPRTPGSGRYWIAPTASVIGNVVMAEDSSIWFGAVLRGDNEPIRIGERSNIQDMCVCHTDPGFPLEIGADCTIGHRAILHGCRIGDNSLIGMGAIILNGAHIGANCLIGAGALVPEGKSIPDGSLVIGMPAKVIRSLDEAAIAGLTRSAQSYVENWRRFSAELSTAQ